MSILVVTGTGTGVGKTVVTAALAAATLQRGGSVAVVKPAQTGVTADEPGDLQEVARLCGARRLREFARFPDPLAPATAARLRGMPAVDLDLVAAEVAQLRRDIDLVLVEGAGGLLVHYDDDGRTLADLARTLDAPVLVVTAAGLGTLNHTALTLEVAAGRGLRLSGVVVGAWPVEPDLAMRCNLTDLTALANRPLAGVVPDGVGRRHWPDPEAFAAQAREWLAPAYGGTFDPSEWIRQQQTSNGLD
jgi:dethiobiotin synthetase